MPLSDERKKELSEKHPLFRILTGQVIWTLFEEYDATPDDIGAFLDKANAWRLEQIEILAKLEDNPESYLQIVTIDEGTPCADCIARNGRVMQANHPDLLRYIPPYAVGCRCQATIISAEKARKAPKLDELALPSHQLHCPSEWIFHVQWAKNQTQSRLMTNSKIAG